MPSLETYPIRGMDLGIGLHVTRYGSLTDVWGVVVAIGETPEHNAMTEGPYVTVRWWLGPDTPPVTSEQRAGSLRRVHRRLHWDGDPDACAEDCEGSHYGDHLAPGACCERCGGSARACFYSTEGRGCEEFTYREY